MTRPLIPEDQTWTLFAMIVAGTALSVWLEGRYRWAEKLSAPVIALLIAMVLSNTGVMPAKEGVAAYEFVGAWLVPVALPLLLMQANVVKIAREAGRLMFAVLLASAGTIVGAFAAVALLKDRGIAELDQAAAIMTGSYIGGMVNFAAIKESTGATAELTTGLIVADNIVMAGFFLLLLWMAGSKFFLKHYPHPHSTREGHAVAEEQEKPVLLTVNGLGAALAFAFGIVAIAMACGKLLGGLFPAGLKAASFAGLVKMIATNKFVLITGFSLVAATAVPRPLERLRGYERIGTFLLFLYLFSIGLPTDLRVVLDQARLLFVLCLIMAVGNVIFTMVLGKLFRLDLEELLLAINATLGGPPTAAAMAASRGWRSLVLPGLLAGLWGYIIGTPLGLMVFSMLS